MLNSVLGAPAYLSGVSESHKTLWLRQYHEDRNPSAVKRIGAYKKALELLETRSHLVIIEMEKAQGGSRKDVKRLRGQAEASEKALSAILGNGE